MELRRLTENPILILSTVICAALLVPALFMDGMFMDGLIYSCVGKNLSLGIGTFWDPQFSATYMMSYHEQPPLMFGMEAIFFKLLGTSMYTERVYCLFMAIMCFLALRFTWKTLFEKNSPEQKLVWIPILFFFASPVTFWAYTNNVEEATMVVFALASAGCQWKGIRAQGNGFGWFALGGFALIAASMCKGMQGLFPIIIPITWFIFVRTISLKKAILGNSIVFAIPAIWYLGLSFYEPAVNSYTSYFHDRILATFNVAGAATTSSRFFLLFELLLNVLPALFVGTLLAIAARKIIRTYRKEAVFFLLIGLAGIIPLMITLEQRGFYLLTALPFIAIALALCVIDGGQIVLNKVERSKNLKLALHFTSILFLSGTLVATFLLAGEPKRDADLLHDVELIGRKCGKGSTVSANESTRTNWSLQGYFIRYHNISIARNDTTVNYYIIQKGDPSPIGYSPAKLETRKYDLYLLTTDN